MATVLITGGSGMIGQKLSKALEQKGYDVIILTRDIKKRNNKGKIRYAEWSVEKNWIDGNAFAESDIVVHLAGEGIADKRWTKERKKQIRDSRVKSGELLRNSLSSISNHVRTIVSASAIGWYGPDPENALTRPFIESDPAAEDFLGKTCNDWENSLANVPVGVRVVWLRTGIVLDTNNGALPQFMKYLKLGMVPVIAGGKQNVSWIHIDDLVNFYIFSIENNKMQGPYNAVAPEVISNKDLMMTIAAAAKKGRLPFPVPSILPKLLLGEVSMEVLKSVTVSAEKTLHTGFHFKFPTIISAINDLVAQRNDA